ncbi:hypothetical protein [Rummeliibacillus stabekisii]|uniref:hypothetical protein n=1 Tax=Rummeliibacillus stabekisii TaxID=241244 RepID=UPI0037223ACA
MGNPFELLSMGTNETVLTVIKIIQMVIVPLFGMMTLIGIFLFLYAFKNPIKKRLAFLFTIVSPVGFLVFLYGMVLLSQYVFRHPAQANGEGVGIMVTWVELWGSPVYHLFTILIQPILALIFLIGLVVLHHKAGIPARQRIGVGVLLGVPFLWVLVLIGPSIYHTLIS